MPRRKQMMVAKGLKMPLEAVTETFAFLGRRGSGKTYAATLFAEELLTAEAQTVIFDPVGNWYGLRLDATGRKSLFDIPVFGGEYGDIPLTTGSGSLIAQLVVEKDLSVILDVSNFRKNERVRFMTDFAETLFHLKKTHRSAMHIIIEEAQKFIPQQHKGDTSRLLGAMEDIVRLGRNYGIGATLISQRPQSVNKEVLNQCECLFCFQTTGPQERKALEAWIVDKGLDSSLADMLPGLPVGTAYVWSPQWLGVLDTYAVNEKRSYDASSTPKLGQTRKPPRKLARDELKWIEAAMAETIEEAKANDPTALKARIRELEHELAKKPPPEVKIKEVRVPIITDKDRKMIAHLREGFDTLRGSFESKVVIAEQVLKRMEAALAEAGQPLTTQDPGAVKTADGVQYADASRVVGSGAKSGRFQSRQPNRANTPRPQPTNGEIKLVGRQRTMLTALASVDGHALSRKQLAVMVGMSPGSGGFNNYVGALAKQGLIETGQGTVSLTDKGHGYSGGVSVATKPRDILELWLPKVTGKAKDILRLLFDSPGESFDRTAVAEQVGMSPGSGGFNNYVGKLSSLDLIITGRGSLRLNREVFHL